jgi:GntR family transcriptional regulator, N-acetylglucosamine utilization regulator
MSDRSTPALDRRSPIPLYAQLASWLEGRIAADEFPPGSKLPPEGELASSFQLNRNTVRHALSSLVQRGLLTKEKGVGTFVRRSHALSPVHRLDRMTSFLDDFKMGDVLIEDSILSKERLPAPPDLAAKLELALGDDLVKIDRLRFADKTPLLFESQFYSHEKFGELLDMEIRGSMYQILTARFNVELHHSSQTLRAVQPPAVIARTLKIRPDVPCMYIESLAYNAQDACVELLQSYYRGDRYMFRVETGEYRREMNYSMIS